MAMMSNKLALAAVLLLGLNGCNQGRDGMQGASAQRAQAEAGMQAGTATPDSASAMDPAAAGARAVNPAPRSRSAFASLPDRGDLVDFPREPVVRREGAYTWHRADISEAHALRAVVDGVLRITTPSGEVLRFRYQRHVEHASGDWTWVGRILDGGVGQEAILTFGAEAAFGSIDQPGKAALRLTARDGAAWLVETDRSMLARIDNSATRPTTADFLIPPVGPGVPGTAKDGSLAASTSVAGTSAATTAATTVVDLVIGFTGGYAADQGGASAAVTRLNFMVEVTNQAYLNSQVQARVRLVHTLQVNYTDTNSNDAALKALSGTDGQGNDVPVPAALQPLRNARETYGADLVSLVRKFYEPENEGCGIAWLLGGGLQPIHAGYAPFGYSVVSDGTDAGTDGLNYYCRDETLAHELGHNMGSAHDVETAKGDDGVLDNPDDYGRYSYSFGYKTGLSAGDFYTIMAYGDRRESPPYQTAYRVFSNPRSVFCGGFMCGTPNADNARSLEANIPIIASFRNQVVIDPVPVVDYIRNDVDGDGNSDLLWRNNSATRLAYWIMQEAVRQGSAIFSVGSQWTVVATGDLTGDARADLVWSNGSVLYLWASNGTSFDVTRMRSEPAGWDVFDAGDVDGDGKDDLIWRSEDNTRLAYWIMDGPTLVRSWATSVGSSWQLTIADDLTGDDRVDLVWTNGSRLVLWTGNGTTFGASTIETHPAGWTLVDSGDVNGDGKADLIWRNTARTRFGYWLMDGDTHTATRVWSVGPGWRVAAVGDYNADGNADITWTSSTRLVQWVGNGSTFDSKDVAAYPTGWTLLP